MAQTPTMCIDERTHTVHPLCLWHMLHFSAHSFQIICHLAFLAPCLSVVFCWLFYRKQRQQPLGRRWKTTTRFYTQLSTNVLFISSLPLIRHNSRFVAVLLMSACYNTPSWPRANASPNSPIFIYFAQQRLKATFALLPVQWDLNQRAPPSELRTIPAARRKSVWPWEAVAAEWTALGFHP